MWSEMVKLTPLAVSVLALLVEKPMHPYEMYNLLIGRHEDRIVKVRPGSLYHTVERLAGQELVQATGTERAGNRPERTTYTITAAGRAALRDRVTEMLATRVEEFPEFPLAISEAHNLGAAEVVELLSSRIAELDAGVAEIDGLVELARNRGVAEAYWLAADYLRAIGTAERDWIARLIERISSEELSWPTK
ncbi:MAG TPA: PadR family transcriptional regulator [Kribbellaceae bacterium]|nr:PadR family transcriptional regulator [Kribbellaceae bacterium]